MAGRYLLSGVQLGMLIGLSNQIDRQDLVDKIERDQYVGFSKKDIDVDVKRISSVGFEQ